MENEKRVIKAKAHVPTEMYGYLEVEMEGTELEVAQLYYKIKDAIKEAKKDQPPF